MQGMQYSPKLKVAMEKIKKILRDEDIAGLIVLHTPGFGEYVVRVDPSYSYAKLEGDTVRIKTNPEHDLGTKNTMLANTYDIFGAFAELAGPVVLGAFKTQELIEKEVEVVRVAMTKTSHDQQNN